MIEEFLIALGVKADTNSLRDFERGLDDVTDSAEQTEGAMVRAYDATDGFVSAIEGALGVIGFFTGVLGGLWGAFHGTIMELEDLIKEEKLLNEVTKDQLEQQKKYKESVETLGKRFQSLKVEMAFGYLPTMQKMIDVVDRFLEANGEMIINGLMKMISVMTSVVTAIINTVRFIDLIIDSTIGWKNALLILGGIFVWLKRAMLLAFVTNPVMWIIAAIAGLIILIDDFMTYLDGGESEFGDFWGECIKWVEKAKKIWNEFSDEAKSSIKALLIVFAMLTPMFGGLTGTIMTLAKAFLSLGRVMLMNPIGFVVTIIGVLIYFIIDLIKWLNGGESKFSSFWEACRDVWNKIVDWTSQAIEKMINAVKGFIDDVGAFFSGIYDAIVNPFKRAFDWVSSKWNSLKGLFGASVDINTNGSMGRAVSNTSNNRTVTNTSTTNANFNVNGAVSPQATANAINSNLNSITQSNMGGMAKA